MNIIRALLIIIAFALAGIGVALGVYVDFVIGVLVGSSGILSCIFLLPQTETKEDFDYKYKNSKR
jgi:uncharacterized membrane protein